MVDLAPALLLLTIAGLHLLAAISPGPAFVMVSRLAVGSSRRAGIAAGCGVAGVAGLWATAACFGLTAVFAAAPWLMRAIQCAGGGYLLWIGIQSWRHAAASLPDGGAAQPVVDARSALARGFKTSLGNPKIMIFFSSIFATLITPDTPLWLKLGAIVLIMVDEALWYAVVACAFASGPMQRGYRRAKAWIDRATGSVLGGFGIRLIVGAAREGLVALH